MASTAGFSKNEFFSISSVLDHWKHKIVVVFKELGDTIEISRVD